jgi:hypothetical protein
MEQHYILHISREAQGYKAMVLGHTTMGGWGPTRAAAIHQAQAALRQALTSGEIVSVTVDVPDPNPWLEDAGIWKEDPQWNEYQAALEEYRREVNEREALLD